MEHRQEWLIVSCIFYSSCVTIVNSASLQSKELYDSGEDDPSVPSSQLINSDAAYKGLNQDVFSRYATENVSTVFLLSETSELTCFCSEPKLNSSSDPVYYRGFLDSEESVTLPRGSKTFTACQDQFTFHPRKDKNRQFTFQVRCYSFYSKKDIFKAVELIVTRKPTLPWLAEDGYFTFNGTLKSTSPCSKPGVCPEDSILYNMMTRDCCTTGVPLPSNKNIQEQEPTFARRLMTDLMKPFSALVENI